MAFHCELTDLDIHVINTWTYANSAARDAATGFTSDDVYKVAVQTDNNSVWMLVDESPITWQALGGVVISEISHCDLDNLLVDCHTQYMPTDASRAFSQPVCGAPPTIGAHLTTKAYVDGEIVTDHGALNGLLDVEDHPGYSTIDGSRAYTAPVSGQDPTLDNHLTTKFYVDSLTDAASANALTQALAADIDDFLSLTDTPSAYTGKGGNIVRVNAGETTLEFVPSGAGGGGETNTVENGESDGESSTSSTSFQQKLRLTTSVLPLGNYMLQWYVEGRNVGIGDAIEMRIQEDDTTDHGEVRFYSGDSGGTNWFDDFQPFSGHKYLSNYSGSYDFDIDYRSFSGGTAEIRRARITVWRIN